MKLINSNHFRSIIEVLISQAFFFSTEYLNLQLIILHLMTDLRLQIEPGVIPTDKDIDLHFGEQVKEIGLRLNPLNRKDYQELFRILNVYLSYPDSSLAAKHRCANRLGELDLKLRKQRNMRETYIRVENEICNCCGFFVQKNELSNCEEGIMDVNGLGASTVVFFQTFKNIAVLLLIMVVVYAVFSFATDISVAKESSKNGYLDYLIISLGAKANSSSTNDNANIYYLASSWLGVCMLVFWLIALIKMKKDIKILESDAKNYTSVSDFSVVIQKMPIGYKREQVQVLMDEYLARIAPQDIGFRQLKVEKYNQAKPFYFNDDEFHDPELEEAYQRRNEIKQQMAQWIAERIEDENFTSTQQYRDTKIEEFIRLNKQIENKKQEMIRRISQKLEQKSQKTTTFVFVTFETVEQRDFFLSYNSNSILSKIKKNLPCFDKSSRFTIDDQHKKSQYLIIQNAPEPEDINWGNIGFGECVSAWRKFVTAFATLIILGISFAIVYGLSTVQNQKANNRYFSFFISLVISVINLIIIKVIQYMTVFEKLYTNNTYQISLAYKSIFAQLINSIFIPVVVNYHIKSGNIYGESGLTEDIFILAITSSFFPPLIRLIDPYYIFVYLKYNYYNRPLNKIGMTQYELNFIAEKPEYQLGLEYIYLISNFLFTCYFVSLQPIIPLFALLGLLFMYWIEKYSLFNKCQRPIPGIDTINVVMHQLIYLGGVGYALGSLTWAVFLSDQSFRNSLVANAIAAGLGVFIFIFPYEAFVSYKENNNLKKSYSDRRIYFPAEYDRINPVTKREGVREYRQFLLKKKQQIEGLSIPMQQDIAAKLLNLTQNNTYKNHLGNNIFGRNETAEIANQIFLNETRNVLDPKLLRSFLLPQRGQDKNIEMYASSIGQMNRNYSHREVQQKPEQMGRTYGNPYEPEIMLSAFKNDYSFAEKNKEDNFKNMYKSTLNLGDLGLASNNEIRGRHHTNHESK